VQWFEKILKDFLLKHIKMVYAVVTPPDLGDHDLNKIHLYYVTCRKLSYKSEFSHSIVFTKNISNDTLLVVEKNWFSI
jgi:hypothetical protein